MTLRRCSMVLLVLALLSAPAFGQHYRFGPVGGGEGSTWEDTQDPRDVRVTEVRVWKRLTMVQSPRRPSKVATKAPIKKLMSTMMMIKASIITTVVSMPPSEENLPPTNHNSFQRGIPSSTKIFHSLTISSESKLRAMPQLSIR